jgi:Tfp pilus assembly protein PilF
MFYRSIVRFLPFALFLTAYCGAQSGFDMDAAHSTRGQSPDGPSSMRKAVRRCTLTGVVRDLTGKPVKDAHVEIHNRDTGQVIYSGYSGIDGAFEIVNVPHGSYELVASAGLVETRQTISAEGATQEISVLLPNNDPSASAGNANSVSVTQLQIPERARNALHKAQEAMRKQKTADVEKYLAESLQAYPRYADALTLRAILKLDKNEYDDASRDLEQAIKFDPNYGLAYIVLGSAYNLLSHWDDALRVLTRGTSLNPASWQAYFETGRALLGKRDFAAAVQQLSKAQELRPDYALVHLAKAHAMIGLKDYGHALAELEVYLQRDPKSSQAEGARQLAEQIRPLAINMAGGHLEAAQH